MDNPFINLYPQLSAPNAIGAIGSLIKKLPSNKTATEGLQTINSLANRGMAASATIGSSLQSQFNQFFGGGQKPDGGRAIGTQAVLNGKPVYWAGYGWQQQTGQGTSATLNALNAPGVQNRFIQDRIAAPHGGTPEERAHKENAINAAQQAANNPLFQKYQVADLTKQYNEAKTPEQRQSIGLQIWAQTNPQLAAKLKQGQVGYVEAQSAPGMSNAGGNLFSSLPMPSANFSTALSMEPPVTMNQPYSTSLPGVNMVSYNPMAFDTQTNADMYKNPIDMGKIMAGAALNTDPRAMNITQDQRRALINQYNQGLINRPFPPAAK